MAEKAAQKEVNPHKMILKEDGFFFPEIPLLLATLEIVGYIPKQKNIKRGARTEIKQHVYLNCPH